MDGQGVILNGVDIRLWPAAPGCAALPFEHDDRRRTVTGQPLPAILRMVLTRLQLAPHLVEIVAADGGADVLGEIDDVVVTGCQACTDTRAACDGSCTLTPAKRWLPFASILAPGAFEPLAEAREDLIEAGWKPRPAA